MTILVTGSDGQLGKCLKKICMSQEEIDNIFLDGGGLSYYFANREQFDITKDGIEEVLSSLNVDAVINCAAYVNTDGAEEDSRPAFMSNALGPMKLAIACKNLGIRLVHISTDFVFDGFKNTPYSESDICRPINMYGLTKYFGEQIVREILPTSTIIRTSWLYSEFGNNFVTRTISLLSENPKRNYVYDQISSPTYAINLARFILTMLANHGNEINGVFHFSDLGVASRYDFAKEIERLYFGTDDGVSPCLSENMVERSKRPLYSVLDKSKSIAVAQEFNFMDWKTALKNCIEEIKKQG